ncbi:MAG: DUF1571 domain-containing protein [Phycisphaerae bacterium]
MTFRQMLPRNRVTRLLLAGCLVGMIAFLATRSDADAQTNEYVTSVEKGQLELNSPDLLAELERLAEHDHIALLEMCLDHCQKSYQDYTATFIKQERIRGILRDEQTIEVKYRDVPFSVALAWTKNAGRGDRLLYIEGQNDGKMLVRPAVGWQRALVGSQVAKDPSGDEAMKSTLRPVTMFGFARGLTNLLDVYRQADAAGDLEIAFGGYSSVSGRKCIQLVRTLPAKDDYPCHVTEIHIDLETLLPICIKGYDWDGKLASKYLYQDLQFNVGLRDEHFSPAANGME